MTAELGANQLDFGAQDAEFAREFGMSQAYQADRVQLWKDQASAWLAACERGRRLTADDLVADIGLPDEGPGRNNVVGAWVNAQARAGLIRWTGEFRHSARVIGHRNLQRLWVKT